MNMNVSLDERDVGPLSLAPVDSVFPESGTRGTYWVPTKLLSDKQSCQIEENSLRGGTDGRTSEEDKIPPAIN